METFFFEWMQHYAYEPVVVYCAVVLVMLLSSFGLPIPEEISIIGLGVLSYIGSRPDLYPPPYPNAPHIDVLPAMLVCALSIFATDFVVYSLGRYFGKGVVSSPWFLKLVPKKRVITIKAWMKKWGNIVPGLFRLIPGVRFPGHLMCGALGVTRKTFLCVDGLVVMLVVPMQIYFISIYGEEVIQILKKFQLILGLLCVLIFAYLIWNSYKIITRKPLKSNT